MHIVKLPWFGHKAEGKKVECYSVSINAEGSRLASGGLDGNVKIWDTHTILQFKSVEGIDLSDTSTDFDRLLPPVSQRRALCSMSRHNGVVTSVKFSPDGRFLASGSDDKIVLIWEKDNSMVNRPIQFGEAEADLEHWTVRKRLVAHENDIQDICWSPDGSLLVTVGLDRSIIIWSGTTFERIKRYDIHQSMVKGIVFDPANKFFATASDDRTVRVFRYSKKMHESVNDYEFQMEHVVFDPFKKSPLTSYFRRMSWSPDGQNIAVPNAMNGPVPSVAIIKRGDWSTDVSLIGHEAPCEVCSFSPKLFSHVEPSKSKKDNFYTVLATGGQDNTLAIWSTSSSKPLVIAQDITESSITDICWSVDGETLYISCLDGSITCVSFDHNELGIPVSAELLMSQLHKFGKDTGSNVFPESIQQLLLEEKAKTVLEKEDIGKSRTPETSGIPLRMSPKERDQNELKNTRDFKDTKDQSVQSSQSPAKSAAPQVNILNVKAPTITMKNGKKRVAPTLVSVSSSKANVDIPIVKTTKRFKQNSKLSHQSYLLPRSGLTTAIRGTKDRRDETNPHEINEEKNDIDALSEFPTDPANNRDVSVSTLKKQKNKMKKQIMEAKYPSYFKYVSNLSESLFNHTSLMQYEMSKIINAHDFEQATELFAGTSASADTNDEDIIFAVLVAGVSHKPSSLYDLNAAKDPPPVRTTLEVRNAPSWEEDEDELELEYNRIDFQDPTSVIVTHGYTPSKKYVIYYPFKIQHALPIIIDNQLMYFVLASFDGTLSIVFAESGTLLCPNCEIGTNFVFLKQQHQYLMGITSSGLIYVWKLPVFPESRVLTSVINAVSMAAVMNTDLVIASDNRKSVHLSPDVKAVDINPSDGSPFVMLTNNCDVYQYNISLQCWIKAIDSWYFHAVKDSVGGDKVFDFFYYMSSNGFKERVEKNEIGRYLFDESTKELEAVMNERHGEFKEMVRQTA